MPIEFVFGAKNCSFFQKFHFYRILFNQETTLKLHHQQIRKKFNDLRGQRRHKAVEREEARVAESMTEFFAHGRGTGGGSLQLMMQMIIGMMKRMI